MIFTGQFGVIKAGGVIVAEVRSFTADLSCDSVDATTQQLVWKNNNATQKSWGGSLTCLWDNEAAGQALLVEGAKIELELYPSSIDGESFTGTAIITNIGYQAGMSEMVMAAFSFIGIGELTSGSAPVGCALGFSSVFPATAVIDGKNITYVEGTTDPQTITYGSFDIDSTTNVYNTSVVVEVGISTLTTTYPFTSGQGIDIVCETAASAANSVTVRIYPELTTNETMLFILPKISGGGGTHSINTGIDYDPRNIEAFSLQFLGDGTARPRLKFKTGELFEPSSLIYQIGSPFDGVALTSYGILNHGSSPEQGRYDADVTMTLHSGHDQWAMDYPATAQDLCGNTKPATLPILLTSEGNPLQTSDGVQLLY